MADIMLEDGSGVPQPYENVETLEVDGANGGTEKFVSERLIQNQAQADWNQTDETAVDFIKNKPTIPEASSYTHPATHPASMITDLAPVATGGQFKDLWKKPFYDLPSLEESEIAFNKDYDDMDCYFAKAPGTWECQLGESYKVTWDGTEYTCVCKDIADVEDVNITGLLYLGNFTHFFAMGWGEGTGEPFVLAINSVLDSGEYGNGTFMTTDTSAAHTVSITPMSAVKKLDEKYLPDTAATKQWVQEFAEETLADLDISGGSGGTAVTETEIVPEMELPFTALQGVPLYLWQTYGNTDVYPDPKLCELAEGKTYIVVWDGIEYPCVANIAEIPNDGYPMVVIGIGNWSLGGVGEDTGEPFAFGVFQDGSNTAIYTTDSGDTHTIRIYQKSDLAVSWDSITDKPFGGEDVTILEGQFVDTKNPDGTWTNDLILPTSPDTKLIPGDTYIVTWEGVEYTTQCVFVSSGEEFVPTLGNLKASGGSDTGEPFIIMRPDPSLIGGHEAWVALCHEYNDTGTFDCKIVHSSVKYLDNKYLEFIDKGGTIKPEYIPSPPEFDLTAMGLPSMVIDGSGVWVNCDTTELRAALNRGSVKINVSINVGQDVPVSMIVSPFAGLDAYQINGLGYFAGFPVFIAVIVNDSGLEGRVITLSVPTT